MLYPYRLLLLPIVIAACAVPLWAAAPQPLPTVDQVHQEFSDGKYHDAVHDISRLAASREWSGKNFDKYELLTLKAEAHIRLKEAALAATTFDAAAREAPDKAAAGLARSTAYLIKHSVGAHYVPKATANKHVPGQKAEDHPTIDYVEPEGRKQALAALLQDEKDGVAETLQAATDGKSVQAVLDAVPALGRLRDFDFAANGNDNETVKAAVVIADHGRDLLTDMVDKMTIRVDVLYGKAFDIYPVRIYNVDRWRKHGLEGKETAELTDLLAKSDKIVKATKLLTEGLATEPDYYARITRDAKRIRERADKMLKTDYSETFASQRAAKE